VKTLRVAVVGAGRLGGFHAQKLAAVQGVELVAVADPVQSQRERVAAACNAPAVADYRDLLDAVDAAVIAAPTQWHHAIAMEFLGWGVHLLVEKPLAATLAQADELVETARRHSAILQVGHVERFNPAMAAAAPHVANPKYIEAVRSSPFTFRSTDVGVVLDLMIHDLDLVLSLVRSPVRRVEALGLSVLGGHEDVANARLVFESGCVAALSASRVSYEAVRRMHVWAPRAFASIDFATRKTRLVRPSEALLRRQFNVSSLRPEEVEYLKSHLSEVHLRQEETEAPAVDALTLELEDFVESIRAPRAPQVTGQHGRDAVAVAEQILDKIRAHAWDDDAAGLVGPLAIPRPSILPAPHRHQAAEQAPQPRKAAG
jgi:predicted dehydrogenase